jgi:HTH-type transcriptional regulator / antitoxin HipB
MCNPDWSQELGSTVRNRRKLLRLTQEQVGLYAGCGAIFVRSLEAGKPTVRLDKVRDVLNVLGLELIVQPRVPSGNTRNASDE